MRDEKYFTILMLLMALANIVVALTIFNPIAMRMPIIVGLLIVVFAIWHLVSLKPSQADKNSEGSSPEDEKGVSLKDAKFLIWPVILLSLVFCFGLIPGAGLMTGLFEKIQAKRSLVESVVYGGAVSLVLQAVFGWGLKVILYKGFLVEIFKRIT